MTIAINGTARSMIEAFAMNSQKGKTMNKELAIECIKTQRQFVDDMTREAFDMAIDLIKEKFPSADVALVRHGHWIKDDVFGIPVYRCSVCDKEFWLSADDTPQGSSYLYCPNCGARMDAKE